jgi:probable HAF family extracellular repeat protein
LTYPGATYTEARAINNGGTIVGYYEDASGGYHGFLLSNGTYTALNYPGASATYAFGINDGNTIDGYYEDASGVGHGFLLSNGTYTALNYPGASGTYAGHGNNAGAIVGAYLDASSVDHGFLAIPATALSSGWNLVSLPFQPANTAIASVLSGIADAYEVVWAYPGQSWKVYDPNDAGGSTLTTMQAGMGYWIKMTTAKSLTLSGTAPSSSLSLLQGWNLVGYNGTSCTATSTALSSISANLQVSWGYPGQVWQFYDPANPGGSTLGNLCPGVGYWIDVNGGASWSGW